MSRDQLTVVGQPQGRRRPGGPQSKIPGEQGKPGGNQVAVQSEGRRMRRQQRPEIDLDDLWAPIRRERAPEDREFLPGALEILEAPASPIRIAMMYAMCALIASGLAWSWFGHLDVYAESTGKFQASGRTKVVQPLDSGKVISILAKDGDKVSAGQVLVELDPTEALANLSVAQDSLNNSTAEISRRQAAIAAAAKDPIDVTIPVKWADSVPQLIRDREDSALRSDLASLSATMSNFAAQKTEAEAQRDKFQSSIPSQKAIIDLIGELVGMRDELFKNGWNSRATLVQMLQEKETAMLALATLEGSLATAIAAIPVIDTEIVKTRQTFIDTNTQALVSAQSKVDELVQTVAKAELSLSHMTLRAPTAGSVQASSVTTVGQVLATGQQVMNVVPEGTPMEIEAYILNTDAGFIKVGQEATIKVDTFPYTRYGTISGVVTKLATDAMTGKQAQQQQTSPSSAPDGSMSITSAAQQTSDLVFPIIVVPSQTTIMVDGRERPLTSGMTATVEIKTESRRAIDYILSPLHDILSSSAQER